MPKHPITALLLVGLYTLTAGLASAGAPATGPESWSREGLRDLDHVARWVSPQVDVARLIAEDAERANKGAPLRVGLRMPANVTPSHDGTWEQLAGGDRLWRLVVRTEGARWSVLGFGTFGLQPGARLYLFDPDRAHTYGPYTSEDIQSHGKLWSAPIVGDTVVVELFWPKELAGQEPEIRLTHVSHGYKAWDAGPEAADPEDRTTASLATCDIDVVCPEADNFRDELRGVVRTLIEGSVSCSGTLIKSNELLCQPYVLTADHCYDDFEGDSSGTTFLFNYDRPGCGAGVAQQVDFVTGGATRLARSDASDFQLLRMATLPPPIFGAYFNGWSRSSQPATETWTIHHPDGGVKKISHDADPPTVGTLMPAGSHWRAIWDEGTTDGGSSGAPLFDQNGRVVGQVNGGLSSCVIESFTEFGRFDVSWEGDGTPATRLKDWLDPANSEIQTLDGLDASFCGVFVPQLMHTASVVDDPTGNVDGAADPGETIGLQVSLFNESPVGATTVAGTLTAPSGGATITDAGASWPDIAGFATQLSQAPHYSVEIDPGHPCGDPVDFQIATTSTEGNGVAAFSLPTGRIVGSTDVFTDDMESGTNGWTSVNLLSSNPWTQSTVQSSSPTHSWFVPDAAAARDSALVSPELLDLPPEATLTFEHSMNSELAFDGGVLEYTIDGSTWIDAGDLITSGGYNGGISVGFSSQIAGRRAWTGDLSPFKTVEVDLSSLAGEDLTLRWRFASDQSGGGVGWYIDDVAVTAAVRECSDPPLVLLPGAVCTGDRPSHPGTRTYVCGQAPDRNKTRTPRQGRVGRP